MMRGRKASNIWRLSKHLNKNGHLCFFSASYSNAAVNGEVIQAIPREKSGRVLAAKERKLGRVPSVVFEQADGVAVGRKRLLSVETDHIGGLLNQIGHPFFLSRTFDLEVLAGPGSSCLLEKGRVLPRKVHLRPGTDEILNVVFNWAPEHAQLKVNVPLVFRGQDVCPGIRKGGYLNTIAKAVGYLCPTDLIPPYIYVDLSNLDVGEKVLMRDLEVHKSLKLLSQDDSLPICKIMGTRPVDDATTQS